MDRISEIFYRLKDRYYLHRYIFPFIRKNKQRQISPQNCVCVFGFPRSGTTWFAELLSTIPNSCLFFEPLLRGHIDSPCSKPDFNFRKIKEIADLDFYFYQPISTETDWPEAKSLFEMLLKGQALSIGLYDTYGLDQLKAGEIFIIKFTHGNLLSQWLIRQFKFSSIFLLRNPYASIASIMKHPMGKALTIDKVEIPEFKYNEVFKKYKFIFDSIKTKEEYFAFLWCLNTIEGPLNSKNTNSIVVFYEDLILQFEREVERIFNYIKHPVPNEIFKRKMIPSSSTIEYALENIRNNNQLNSWRKFLDDKQMAGISWVLNQFGIDFYTTDSIPNHQIFYSKIK